MGIVYSATHLAMEHRVAVKFLLTKGDGGAADEALVRFRREAKFMAKINSDHVVRVIDVGALPSGTPFIVMEHLDGEDLSRVVLREGRLPIERAIDFVLQACEGLMAAHGAGVVHRDLKPSNLFLAKMPDGREIVKIIDFGVAKYRGVDTNPHNDALTQTHVMVGSPRYMSPEQARASKEVDARADVWALGIILFEFLTGRAVFKGPTMSDSLVLILTKEPDRVDAIRPDVPAMLADVIAGALIKDETKRTQSVATLAGQLLPFASPTKKIMMEPIFAGAPIPPPPRSFSGADASGPVPALRSFAVSEPSLNAEAVTRSAWTGHELGKAKRRKKWPFGVIGVAAVLVIALVAFVKWNRSRSNSNATVTVAAPPTPSALAPALQDTREQQPPQPPPTTMTAKSTAPPAASPVAMPAQTMRPGSQRRAAPVAATPKPSSAPPSTPTTPADPQPGLFDDPK